MVWNKYSLTIPSDMEDIVSASLYEAGVEGVEIEDKIPLTEKEKEEMFVDFVIEMEDDNIATLNFYVDPEDDVETLLNNVKEEMDSLVSMNLLPDYTIVSTVTADIDWVENWKKYFKSFTVDDLLITPSWENPVFDNDKISEVIKIDPGIAFGTGKHETTQLCIKELMKRVKKGDKVLDLGTGSGILSIVALKKGAAFVNSVDIDKNVKRSFDENLKQNNIDTSKINLILGDVKNEKEVFDEVMEMEYDIVVANILAEIIVDINPTVVNFLKDNTTYIMSGILTEKAPKVKKSLEENGIELTGEAVQGEWSVLIGKKKGN